MLVNTSTTETSLEQLLKKLEKSKIKFYLTGSRFFGNSRPESDWDFFTADTKPVERLLDSLGFVVVFDSGYKDGNTAKVFKHELLPVHIQIVPDVEKKLKIQDVLKKFGALNLDLQYKDKQRAIWGFAYELLK